MTKDCYVGMLDPSNYTENRDIESVHRDFSWDIPEYYNIGVDICDRWAAIRPDSLAIVDVDEQGCSREFSFGDLMRISNRLANALTQQDVRPRVGAFADRVGVLLPQCMETAATHIAVTKMGCISLPLFTLFGEDALVHRLRDSGARAIVTDEVGCEKLRALKDALPDLQVVVTTGAPNDHSQGFDQLCAAQSDTFTSVHTRADDPALLIYTSGTTGNPKGALHAHRVLLGHLPGVELSHDFMPVEGDRLWTPADWAWIGGLLDVLMPGLHFGVTIVARRFTKFTPQAAFDLMSRHRVRNVFLPPTAMKLMRRYPEQDVPQLSLRSVASGGETLGAELIDWSERVLGVTANEFYGQTECNMLVSSCAALESACPGIMGRAAPGHRVAIIDPASGERVADGVEGAIAVLAPDPVMFIGYWNNPAATQQKFVAGPDGSWLLTGDRGLREEDGRFRFIGRDDDIISSAGYRIGPAEIEECLLSHAAVQMAGVVGWPDDLRGTVVAAYVTLEDGLSSSSKLADELAEHVRIRLAAHEYPRIVRFIERMPMTVTGKIIRRELRELAFAEVEVLAHPSIVGKHIE